MNVGVYNQPSGAGLGGASYTISVLAHALSQRHRVDILHHARPPGALSIPRLEAFSGLRLDGVRLRHVDRDWVRLWPARLSRGYDLFVNLTYGLPPPGHATVNVLRVLFPSGSDPGGVLWRRVLRGLRSACERVRWREWQRTYQLVIANSHYTHEWTRRRWAIESEVLYSPVDLRSEPGPKLPLILSVGRFNRMKKQGEMLLAYRALTAEHTGHWRYACVGSGDHTARGQDYLRRIRALAEGPDVDVLVDVDRTGLHRLQGQASIFWHAAGFGEDLEHNPSHAEHFGIATVEAMAAGCVPVVFDAGGQREIVEHGESGFRWRTLEELRRYTGLLMADERLRARMAGAARIRAGAFGRERFLARFGELLAPLLPGLGPLTP